MAAGPTDTETATSGDVAVRWRGKSKAPNFKYDGPVSVIRLVLDASDARVRRRAGRLPTCQRLAGVAGLPARVGGLSQPAPATSNTCCRIGQDRQPPPGGLC
jgi:hypothetical protein